MEDLQFTEIELITSYLWCGPKAGNDLFALIPTLPQPYHPPVLQTCLQWPAAHTLATRGRPKLANQPWVGGGVTDQEVLPGSRLGQHW